MRQLFPAIMNESYVDNSIERAPWEIRADSRSFSKTLSELDSRPSGESSMKAILYHLSLERLGSDPQAFDKKPERALNAPATIIEEIIVKDLFKRLDLLYSPKGAFDFQRYTSAAREFYVSRRRSAYSEGDKAPQVPENLPQQPSLIVREGRPPAPLPQKPRIDRHRGRNSKADGEEGQGDRVGRLRAR